MNKFTRYTEFNSNISNAMLQCECKKNAEYLVEFLKEKADKYTYNMEEEKYYINSFFPTIPSTAWSRMVKGISEIVTCNKRVPFQADIVVTGKCHCHCWHCFRSKYAQDDLSFEVIRDCINNLYKMGTVTVGITGGEPMLRNDIIDIIKLIPDGMEGQLYTTGYGIDEEMAIKIKDTNLTRCIISLDHYEENVVCQLRHNPNAFKDALKAIKALTAQNIYTSVTVCVTEELLRNGSLRNYFEFVGGLDVQEIRVIMQIPQGNLERKGVGRIYAEAIGLVKSLKAEYSLKKEFPVIVNFCEFESADYIGCGAGSNYISVNNDGMVTPCVAVPLSFGNVYDETLESIYNRMGECFPKSDCVCYGIASSRLISKAEIDTSATPLPVDISFEIAKKCRTSTERAAMFSYCERKCSM